MQIKFPQILATLLAEGRFSGTRKELCDKVGISPSLLSQLVRGQSRPSLTTLVRLARFLDVSLDYLVLGVEQQAKKLEPVDYGPLARHVDLSLARLQAQNDERNDLLGRIALVLSQQIDRAAEQVAAQSGGPGGMLRDDEVYILEGYSNDTWILSTNLQYDLFGMARWDVELATPRDLSTDAVSGADGKAGEAPQQVAAGGRFLPVVLNNLRRGARYRILLPAAAREWESVVDTYRNILLNGCPDPQLVHNNCQFRVTQAPVVVGCSLYQLDMPRFEREEPILYEQVRTSVRDGWIAYMIPPSPEPQANALMDGFHRQMAKNAFDELWKRAHRI
ncbi:MAG TPA: helix-turn-helix transcriptional regulator [Chloroflexota bacterium]|nr:helix-turn-helix transcriptional regulator [Chloroflexota bacterium]